MGMCWSISMAQLGHKTGLSGYELVNPLVLVASLSCSTSYQLFKIIDLAGQTMWSWELVWTGQTATSYFKNLTLTFFFPAVRNTNAVAFHSYKNHQSSMYSSVSLSRLFSTLQDTQANQRDGLSLTNDWFVFTDNLWPLRAMLARITAMVTREGKV